MGNSEQANQQAQPRLLRWFRWLVARVMVHFGLADGWIVRVNGEQLEGLHPLDRIAEFQGADSRARIQIRSPASEGRPGSPWADVYPSQRFDLGFRIVVWMLCALLGAGIGAYVLNGNSDSRAAKLAGASAVGLGSAVLAGVGLWWTFGSFLFFCHLFFDHRRAFWRGAWPGAVGGAVLGCLASLSLVGLAAVLRAAAASAALLGTTGGLLLGCARARLEHDHEQGGPRLCSAARRAGQLLAALLL